LFEKVEEESRRRGELPLTSIIYTVRVVEIGGWGWFQ
jgi:hypothetical protein